MVLIMSYSGIERRENVDWHLNKGVSLSIIILLVVNIATSAWYLSAMVSDIEVLKSKPDLSERVVRLEARADEQGRILSRLDSTLDKLDNTLNTVAKEQARRTSIINSITK